jgi:hypothetical protein
MCPENNSQKILADKISLVFGFLCGRDIEN